MGSVLGTTSWSRTDRIRAGHPVYGALLPSSPPWFVAFAIFRLALFTLASLAVGTLVHGVPFLTPLVYLIAITGAIAGVKHGQRHYIVERHRASSLTILTGADPAKAYFWSTSAVTAVELVLVIPLTFAAAGWLFPAITSTATTVAIALVVGRVAREFTAQAAVSLSEVQVPQYFFVPFGLAMGSFLLLFTPTPGRAVSLPSQSQLVAVVVVVLVLALPLTGFAARLAMHSPFSTGTAPLSFRNRPWALPVRLWTVSDRKTSSLTMGMTAIGLFLVDRWLDLGPAALARLQGFQQADIAIAVCYVLAYMAAAVAVEPLRIREIADRADLLALVGVPPSREVFRLSRAVFVPVLVVALVVGGATWTAFGVRTSLPVWLVAVLLVTLGACGAVIVGKVPDLSLRTGSTGSEASVGVLAKTTVLSLWPATTVLAYLATPGSGTWPWMPTLLSLAMVAAACVLMLDFRRTINRRCAR